MSQVITKRTRLSRRIFLKGLTAAHLPVMVGIPPLVSMFNSTGTAYAADAPTAGAIHKRFVIWFNGNGIPERYWIPSTTGANYDVTPCLTPIGRLKDDVLVLSGLDNTLWRQRSPSIALRADDVHAPKFGRSRRAVARPGAGVEDRRQFAFSLAADRRLAGVVRRSRPKEHELGRSEPPAAARGDSAPAVRPPVRRPRPGLGQPQAEHSGRAGQRRRAAAQRSPHGR